MKPFSPLAPLCFISTHLDDVILSCGYFLAQNPQATIITVLAGAPDKYSTNKEWNTFTTGEAYAPKAIKKRRNEDLEAAQLLKAKTIHLDGWDSPYLQGQKQDEAALADKLNAALANQAFGSIICPIGLHHADHLAVANATRRLTKKVNADFYCYLDLPYAVAFAGELAARLQQLRESVPIEELEPVQPVGNIKDRAFQLYRSQYAPIKNDFSGSYDQAMQSPERYWLIEQRR